MSPLYFEQEIKQLEPRKGGYYYLTVDAAIVETLPRKKATRLVCVLDDKVALACGLNHLGNGHFFIIVAGKHLKVLGKQKGDVVKFSIAEDPNPLGVAMPEVLAALLEQDEDLKARFDSWTDGRKRTLIHAIKNIKDIDRQVQQAIRLIQAPAAIRTAKRTL